MNEKDIKEKNKKYVMIRGREVPEDEVPKNIRYTGELSERKKEYLEKLKNDGLDENTTLSNYRNILHKLQRYESIIGKELEYYGFDDIIKTLSDLQSSSETTLIIYKTTIVDYLTYCMRIAKCVPENIALLSALKGIDLSHLVNKTKKENKYINEAELYDCIDLINNPQDQLMMLLIFEGVRGKENIEIIELKNDDVDFEKHELSYGIEERKILKLNPFLEEIIENTMHTNIYKAKNGDKDRLNKEAVKRNIDSYPLVKSEFIIRPNVHYYKKVAHGKVKDGQMLGILVQKRVLTTMKEVLDRQFITVNSLYISGMINRAVKYSLNTKGCKLTQQEFIEYFKIAENGKNGYRIYDIYNELYKDFSNNLVDF